MKIVVMGAGALGAYFGAFLQKGGHEVTLIARGAHLQALQTKGLTLRFPTGDETVAVRAIADAAAAGPADLVFLATKGYSNADAIEAIRPLVTARCPVMTIQNGISAPHDLAKAFGAQCVLPATVAIGCGIVAPGVVYGPAAPAKITLGEMDGAMSDRITAIQQAFQESSIPVELRSDVLTFLWQKLVYVAPRSVILALSRSSVGFFPQVEGALDLFGDLMREYVAVGRAEGAQLDESMVEGQLAAARGGSAGPARGAGQMPSLQQDAEARKMLEVDEMIGAVVRLGQVHQVPTPIAATLCTLLQLQDATNRARVAG